MEEQDKRIIKETIKESRFGIFLFIAFWIAGWLGVPIFLLFCTATGLIMYGHIKNKDHPKKILVDFVWLTSIILLALWLGAILGGRGLLGLGIIVFVFSMILLWRKRKLYMQWIYHIEERFLYGKRLRRKK